MSIKLVRKPRSAKIQFAIIRREIKRNLKPVADNAVKARDRVVSNWNNKPTFKSAIKVTQKLIEIIIVVRRGRRLKGSKFTLSDLWNWIDKTGTRPHIITPKRAKFLAFQGGKYQSKTDASPARFGGPGKVSNPTPVFTQKVKHPGFKARKFSEAINRDSAKDFDKAIRKGYRDGFKKISSK